MQRSFMVKAYVPLKLAKRLDKAAGWTGQSKSLIIGAALHQHLKALEKEYSHSFEPLPGQL